MVGMVGMVGTVGVARKVAVYTLPIQNHPDPTNVDSDPLTPIQPTPIYYIYIY